MGPKRKRHLTDPKSEITTSNNKPSTPSNLPSLPIYFPVETYAYSKLDIPTNGLDPGLAHPGDWTYYPYRSSLLISLTESSALSALANLSIKKRYELPSIDLTLSRKSDVLESIPLASICLQSRKYFGNQLPYSIVSALPIIGIKYLVFKEDHWVTHRFQIKLSGKDFQSLVIHLIHAGCSLQNIQLGAITRTLSLDFSQEQDNAIAKRPRIEYATKSSQNLCWSSASEERKSMDDPFSTRTNQEKCTSIPFIEDLSILFAIPIFHQRSPVTQALCYGESNGQAPFFLYLNEKYDEESLQPYKADSTPYYEIYPEISCLPHVKEEKKELEHQGKFKYNSSASNMYNNFDNYSAIREYSDYSLIQQYETPTNQCHLQEVALSYDSTTEFTFANDSYSYECFHPSTTDFPNSTANISNEFSFTAFPSY